MSTTFRGFEQIGVKVLREMTFYDFEKEQNIYDIADFEN